MCQSFSTAHPCFKSARVENDSGITLDLVPNNEPMSLLPLVYPIRSFSPDIPNCNLEY